MSLPDYPTAVDTILGLFKEHWEAETPALNAGSPVRVEWPGVDSGGTPPPDQPYARIRVRHTTSRQVTFGKVGERRFNRPGFVTVQIFAPIVGGSGLTFAENLATIARNAYEGRGTPSGIWFRRSAIQDIGEDGTFHQFNVVVEFEYDEMR